MSLGVLLLIIENEGAVADIRNPERNSEARWQDFDTVEYYRHNYLQLRADDRVILEAVRDFFAKITPSPEPTPPRRGLDLGAGPNLYPSLAMLPFCTELTLWEYAAPNVAWLREEIASYSSSWDQFWARLNEATPYQQLADPRSALAERATVQQGSVFDLPARRWDIGTMFFVTESATGSMDEFIEMTHRFIGALRPNAPFAAAFMEESTGWSTGPVRFPAVQVTPDSIRACLEPVTAELFVERIGLGSEPVRAGYSGMLIALGTVRSPDSGPR